MKRANGAALYLLVTFLCGAAVGCLGFWLYTAQSVSADRQRPSSDEYRQKYMTEMEARLKLTPEQKTRLVSILDQTRTLYREVYEKHRPEYEAIQQHHVSQINAILSEDQQKEYAQVQKERESRRRRTAPY
jgi:hypothetical protein